MLHSVMVIAPYRILACAGGLPDLYDYYREHALLAEEFDLDSPTRADAVSFFGIGTGAGWPQLTVAQRYEPTGAGFSPGVLMVPETGTVFVGAGARLLAYALEPAPVRIWSDEANTGFWGWQREGDFVLMSAELEFAAWTTKGVKLWSTYVEPPWHFSVTDGVVELDVMEHKSAFPIGSGPRAR